MVKPILNECLIRWRKLIKAVEKVDGYGEPYVKKKYSTVTEILGQIEFNKYAIRRITEAGDDPLWKAIIFLDLQDMVDAGHYLNDDSTLDIEKGDLIEAFEILPGKFQKLNLIIDRVEPHAQDFITGENKFQLLIVGLKDDPSTTGMEEM